MVLQLLSLSLEFLLKMYSLELYLDSIYPLFENLSFGGDDGFEKQALKNHVVSIDVFKFQYQFLVNYFLWSRQQQCKKRKPKAKRVQRTVLPPGAHQIKLETTPVNYG